MREFGEDALIAAFSEIYRRGVGVEIGIGDDGAVVESPYLKEAITTDIASEGIHFNRLWSSARDIGAKIAIANLADLYAMGATPRYVTVAIACSGDEEVAYLLEIARGIESVVSTYGVSVVGGDVVAASSLMVAITAVGGVTTPVLRSGMEAGDCLFVTRGPGESLGGLLLLSRALASADSPEVRFFQRPDFHPEELFTFGFDKMKALIDVSDGLVSDLRKLARASGVGIELEIDEGRLGYLREFAERLELSPIDLFLRSGEEHSFIVAVEAEKQSQVPQSWIRLGEVVPGESITMHGANLQSVDSWHW